jgi:hypothetical protein
VKERAAPSGNNPDLDATFRRRVEGLIAQMLVRGTRRASIARVLRRLAGVLERA